MIERQRNHEALNSHLCKWTIKLPVQSMETIDHFYFTEFLKKLPVFLRSKKWKNEGCFLWNVQ